MGVWPKALLPRRGALKLMGASAGAAGVTTMIAAPAVAAPPNHLDPPPDSAAGVPQPRPELRLRPGSDAGPGGQ
jgi:hypothetical protein